jgi:hypothetical protein
METDVWGPPWVVRIKEEYEGVMGAGERSIKDDEGCEWSNGR